MYSAEVDENQENYLNFQITVIDGKDNKSLWQSVVFHKNDIKNFKDLFKIGILHVANKLLEDVSTNNSSSENMLK